MCKCDRICDEFLRIGHLKLIPYHLSRRVKQHAFCKWHNIHSHATNYYNVWTLMKDNWLQGEARKYCRRCQWRIGAMELPVAMVLSCHGRPDAQGARVELEKPRRHRWEIGNELSRPPTVDRLSDRIGC